MDYRHLENQFKYLTKTVLTPVVNERFLREIGKMEAYLREVNQSSQFCEEMEMIEVKCNSEFNGSEHYKWIQVLRKAGDMLDKEGMGSEFMRLESDGPPSFEGPFIKAINVEHVLCLKSGVINTFFWSILASSKLWHRSYIWRLCVTLNIQRRLRHYAILFKEGLRNTEITPVVEEQVGRKLWPREGVTI